LQSQGSGPSPHLVFRHSSSGSHGSPGLGPESPGGSGGLFPR
jgi:hypothetical protein